MAKNFNPQKGWSWIASDTASPASDSVMKDTTVAVGDQVAFEKTAVHTPTGETTSVSLSNGGVPTLSKEIVTTGSWLINCMIKPLATLINGAIYGFSIATGAAPTEYAPAWLEEKFPPQPQDENGYTILTPPSGATLRYVDPDVGDDGNAIGYAYNAFPDVFLPSSPLAYATINAAKAAMAEGDWMLIKKGSTHLRLSGLTPLNGVDDDHRTVICSYGIGNRPIFKCMTGVDGIYVNSTTKNITINGIDLYSYQSDTDNPDYIPYRNNSSEARGWRGNSSILENISIEDCVIRFFSSGIGFGTYLAPFETNKNLYRSNIRVRNNIILNSHSSNAYEVSHGAGGSGCSLLLENNYFDHNGFVMNLTSGIEVARLPITSAVSTISVLKIPADAPASDYLRIVSTDSTVSYIPYTSYAGNDYTVSPTDTAVFVAHPVASGNSVTVNVDRASTRKHNTYFTSMRYTAFANNIFSRSSSMQNKFTSNITLTGIFRTTIASALNSAGTTSITVNDTPSDGFLSSGKIGFTKSAGGFLWVNITAHLLSYKTFTIASTDFSSTPIAKDSPVIIYLNNRETTKSPLTGAAETSVSVSSMPVDSTGDTGSFSVLTNSGNVVQVNYTSVNKELKTYYFSATDFTVDPADTGNKLFNDDIQNYESSYEVYIYDNCYVEGDLLIGAGGNDSNHNGYRWRDFHIASNVSQFLGRSRPYNRDLGWGYNLIDQISSSVTNNFFLTSGGVVPPGYATKVEGYAKDIDIKNNLVNDSSPNFQGGEGLNQENIVTENNIISQPEGYYLDASRNIESYLVHKGETGSLNRLTEIVKLRTKDNPLVDYTAKTINSWIKAGYVEQTNLVMNADLVDAAYALGGYTVAANFYSPETITYKWFVNGTEDVSNTDVIFVGAGLSGDFTLKVTASSKGQTVSSRTATIEEKPSKLTLSGTKTVTFSPTMTVSVGETLSFNYKSTSLGVDSQTISNGPSNYIKAFTTGFEIKHSYGSFVYFDIDDFADTYLGGVECVISIPLESGHPWRVIVNGTTYYDRAASNVSGSAFMYVTTLGASSGFYGTFSISNVSDTVNTFFIASGGLGGTSELGSNGTSTATFSSGIVAEDWGV